jgi:hypothetical protein
MTRLLEPIKIPRSIKDPNMTIYGCQRGIATIRIILMSLDGALRINILSMCLNFSEARMARPRLLATACKSSKIAMKIRSSLITQTLAFGKTRHGFTGKVT